MKVVMTVVSIDKLQAPINSLAHFCSLFTKSLIEAVHSKVRSLKHGTGTEGYGTLSEEHGGGRVSYTIKLKTFNKISPAIDIKTIKHLTTIGVVQKYCLTVKAFLGSGFR